eukprot:8698559-Heterocapsa_arctica.AAC.1
MSGESPGHWSPPYLMGKMVGMSLDPIRGGIPGALAGVPVEGGLAPLEPCNLLRDRRRDGRGGSCCLSC